MGENFMNQSSGQVAANVEASLTDEKPLATVHFVRTGDTETTILNGCLAVIREVASSLGDTWDPARVFGYLQNRFKPVATPWLYADQEDQKLANLKASLLKAQGIQRGVAPPLNPPGTTQTSAPPLINSTGLGLFSNP